MILNIVHLWRWHIMSKYVPDFPFCYCTSKSVPTYYFIRIACCTFVMRSFEIFVLYRNSIIEGVVTAAAWVRQPDFCKSGKKKSSQRTEANKRPREKICPRGFCLLSKLAWQHDIVGLQVMEPHFSYKFYCKSCVVLKNANVLYKMNVLSCVKW